MKLKRIYNLQKLITPGRVVFLYGPRRVGKTYLLTNFLQNYKGKAFLGIGDDLDLQEILAQQSVNTYKKYFSEYDLIAIDEAQMIPNIGKYLKLLVDLFPNKYFIATGSSALFLNQQVGEPLTGRKWEYTLYPLSVLELSYTFPNYDIMRNLEEYLLFGFYPEVINAKSLQQKKKILYELVNSYLLKDILIFEHLKSSVTLVKLLKLLAYQIGSEVSLSELADNLNIDAKTVERYIDLLVKSFIIYPLGGFSRNLRKEITKKKKYYFIDLGIRNALIDNFEMLDTRPDKGTLWENFLVMERVKLHTYRETFAKLYFWRTWQKQEIDLIEVVNNNIFAYEFKFSPKAAAKVRMPLTFRKAYPEAKFNVIHKENYWDFVVGA